MKASPSPALSASSPFAAQSGRRQVSQASVFDTIRVLIEVILPTFAKGIIIRRRRAEALAQRFEVDRHAVKLMQKLRRKYGRGPLRLALPFRPHVLLLDAADVEVVLFHTPVPYAADTWEKRAALSHFEPGNVLISDPARRSSLRPFHEKALATESKVHPLGQRFESVIREEMAVMLDCQKEGLFGCLGWDGFSAAWYRIVRRISLGDGARDDEGLTRQLDRLRARANWAFLRPRSERKLQEFQVHLRGYITGAEQGSLVAMVSGATVADAESQVAQWLFAFDAAGISTFRALALLAAHPDQLRGVREEALRGGLERPTARACLMESLRLWPTTPAILREATVDDAPARGLAKGSGIVIFAPFFHRDDESLDFAHRMHPAIWSGGDPLPARGLVPFSAGPAMCPAHNLVPLIGSLALGAVAGKMAIRLVSPVLRPAQLPGSLNHFGLKFEMNHLPVPPARQ